MRNKVIWVLFIINSLLILLYVSPFSPILDLFGIISKREVEAIGIIGGVDGPTAVFVSSHINWYLIVMIILDIVFASYLLLTHSKKE